MERSVLFTANSVMSAIVNRSVPRQLVVIVKGRGQLAYRVVGVLWRAWLQKLDLKMAETCAVDILERVISELSHLDQTVSLSTLDSLCVSLETAYRELVVLDLTEQLAPGQHEGMEIVCSYLSTLRNLQDLSQLAEYNQPVSQARAFGRPSYEICEENLAFLLESRFSVPHSRYDGSVCEHYQEKNEYVWTICSSSLFNHIRRRIG